MSVLVFLGQFGLESIKIDSSVEWLQILLVVSFSIEFKNFDGQLLDILEDHIEKHFFFDLELLFVALGKL